MKIRTQLVVAFVVLAVVPLSVLVLVSYLSSSRAVRRAVEAEAKVLATEMDLRMDTARLEVARNMERLGRLPLARLAIAGEEEQEALLEQLAVTMGDSVDYVESLEFVPAPPLPPPAPEAPGEAPQATIKLEITRGEMEPVVIRLPEVLEEIERQAKAAEEAVLAEMRRAEAARRGIAVAPDDPLAAAEFEERWAEMSGGWRGGSPPTPDRPPSGRGEAWWRMSEEDRAALAEKRREMEKLLGRRFAVPVEAEGGGLLGELRPQVRGGAVIRQVLHRTGRGEGEIPFVVDAEGRFYTLSPEDQSVVEALPLERVLEAGVGPAGATLPGWVLATSKESDSGLTFAIARPIGQALEEVRRAAVRNLGFGLGLIGLALLGILPLSSRMTRGLQLVTAGAERIAAGDLDTRVPVTSRNEVGTLAQAFNGMAHNLAEQRRRLLAEERLRKEQEIEQRLLESEYRRKSEELEEARQFQLSLLPKTLPRHASFEVAVSMTTATEVGGDYYDFHLDGGGVLTVALGDATGHGLRAGSMVTAVKSLFSATGGEAELPRFLTEANRAVRRMELGRMAMALGLLRLAAGEVRFAAAGVPPLLVFRRRTGGLEEVSVAGMPLGGLEGAYRQRRLEVAPGDVLLLMSDGFPELLDRHGEPLGYARAAEHFAAAARASDAGAPGEILDRLTAAARDWAGEGPPGDDVTFVALRVA